MSDFSKKVVETQKSAVYVWLGLLLAMTLFYVQSQLVFVHGPARQATVMTVVLFVLGGITYLLASAFFDRYALLKWEDWRRLNGSDRKQQILVGFVFQWILFETLGLYGVLLSVFRQDKVWALPFLVLAYIGFLRSFPRKHKLTPFFPEDK